MNTRSLITGTSWINALLLGAICGVTSSVAPALLRWMTWEPYSPVFIPYDMAAFALAGAAICVLSRGLMKRSDTGAGVIASVLIVCGLLWVWVDSLLGSGGGIGLKIAIAMILACAGWLLVYRVRTSRKTGLALTWFSLVAAIAMAASILCYEIWKPLALIFPVSVAGLFLAGIPRWPASWKLQDLVPLILGVMITATCAATVYPYSGQLVDPRIVSASGDKPSLVLIVLDTLRSDHLPLYGYHRQTTPAIDQWARDAHIFDDVTASSSWTLPSHASMFTGLYSKSHNAHAYRGNLSGGNAYPLSQDALTIAELAREEGYATGAIVANSTYLDEKYGLYQGFDTYWVGRPRQGFAFRPIDNMIRRFQRWQIELVDWPYYRDRYITDNAIRWIDAAGDEPFFLFLNYMDVHSPSARPPTQEIPVENETEVSAHEYDFWQVMARKVALKPEIRNYLVNSYDRELAHLDQELGRLFDYLDKSGLNERATVILTSDHGEYFGEHDMLFHGHDLHESVTRVPLIVKGPGIDSGRTERPAHLVDIFSTALELLGIQVPAQAQGISLFGATGMEKRSIVSEWYAAASKHSLDPMLNGRFDRDLRTLRNGKYKLFMDEAGNKKLYDLASDPAEITDISAVAGDIVQQLELFLLDWNEHHDVLMQMSLPDTGTLSKEDEMRLRALGYID